jgi:threonine/homoserine/homoserine lactone efflux protein
VNTAWSLYLPIVLLGYSSPGPDTVMILRASRHGRSDGFAAAAGVLTGLTIYMLISAVGLSTVIAAAPGTVPAISLVGAIYLGYLGLRTIAAGQSLGRSPHNSGPFGPPTQMSVRKHRGAFKAALVTNLTNPKVMLFFAAILPRFVDQSATLPPAVQLGVLGTVDVLAGIALLPIVVTFGARLFGQLSARGAARFEITVGAVLLTFGTLLAAQTVVPTLL